MIDLNDRILVLDGAMGTVMNKEGMLANESTAEFCYRNPHILSKVQAEYIAAGSDVIYAATFGLSRLSEDRIGATVKEAVESALDAAFEAKRMSGERGKDVKVALDLGSLGELLEPLGTISFEDAYDMFREVVDAGADRADLIVIETMTDLYEVRAALLAAKEGSDLPVFVTMSFEESGRTFTGTSLEAMALTLEGLGADAIGINCSLGPREILPLIKELRELTDLPLIAKPNAGLPDPETGEYDVGSEEFVEAMKEYIDAGVDIIGGCCGTSPEYIKGLRRIADEAAAAGKAGSYVKRTAVSGKKQTDLKVCSGTSVVCVDHVTVIGERINPTGKKRLRQALAEKDFDYVLSQAIEQVEAGAEILDVNVGAPSVNEVEMLPEVIKMLQSVTDVPLQIDSSDPDAIEAALRVYNGKPVVNSVNGEEESMERILPLVSKYGAAVVGLTLDGAGIPEKAEDRFSIAGRIRERALSCGIPEENLIIDCLTLTASAQQKEANETLRAVEMVKREMGLRTALGVSNISFGLPARPVINRTFLTMAMERGLDLPIINPNSEDMMMSICAFNVLKNIDVNAETFIERYGDADVSGMMISQKKDISVTAKTKNEATDDVSYYIEKGLAGETAGAVESLLDTRDEMEIVNDFLIPALDKVGKGFEKGTIFLPQMLKAAAAAQAGFEVVKDRLAGRGGAGVSRGEVVIATVKGDIHDIGKNIVKVIMENYGFTMIDLGRDVPPEKIVETVTARDIKLVGLSALMTTTLKSMEETIAELRKAAPQCRIMVGGAVLTEDYAGKIGADFYCRDAMGSVEAARKVFGG